MKSQDILVNTPTCVAAKAEMTHLITHLFVKYETGALTLYKSIQVINPTSSLLADQMNCSVNIVYMFMFKFKFGFN